MTLRAPRLPATLQLNLPLLQGPARVVPDDQQAELILALVDPHRRRPRRPRGRRR